MVKTRTTYAIYLPSDTEKWFNVTFSKETRAYWYAEMNNLEPDDYEVRPTNETPEVTQTEERMAA